MAKISPDQYIKYDAYCRQKEGKLSPIRMAQVDLLKEADQLCKRCLQFPIEDMRCTGMRLIFQPDESINPHRLLLSPCHKLDHKSDLGALAQRLERGGLVTSRLEKLDEVGNKTREAVVEKQGYDLYFDGVKLEPLVYEKSDPHLVHDVWGYVHAMATHGLQGVYFLTVDYFRAQVDQSPKVMVEKLHSKLLDCDWLIVDMLDYSPAITYIRDSMFMLVKTRVSYCRPTMLIVSKTGPQWQSLDEKEFFEEAQKWPKLNLL